MRKMLGIAALGAAAMTIPVANAAPKLEHVILAGLTVWRHPATGHPIHVEHCRRAEEGCVARVRRQAEHVRRAAETYDVDLWHLAAIAWHETRWNPDVIGPIGEFGLMQLHPRSEWGKQARELCEVMPAEDCDEIRINVAAHTWKRCLDACDTVTESLGKYNTGKCQVNRYARRVESILKRWGRI